MSNSILHLQYWTPPVLVDMPANTAVGVELVEIQQSPDVVGYRKSLYYVADRNARAPGDTQKTVESRPATEKPKRSRDVDE